MKDLEEYRIGVLAGGDSSEREISLKSGSAVLAALKRSGLEAELLDIREEDLGPAVQGAGIDLAFIALHGAFGEDGAVQSMLEEKGIPYTGSGPSASRAALDKLESKNIFARNGIRTPAHRVLSGSLAAEAEAVFPCVVKPRYEGSSVGLSVVREAAGMKEALEKAAEYGEDIIIEKFITGRELTVGILDEETLPVVEIIPADGVYDYSAKYHSRMTRYVVPADLDDGAERAARDTALKAHRALGCDCFSRVDMRMSEQGDIFVLEVNTIPGLTERSLLPMAAGAKGITFQELCIRMIRGALSKV